MDTSKSIRSYLDELSSNSPTPGGGNVSAFLGSLASGLGTMVCNLTIGKKKYAGSEAEMLEVRKSLEDFREKFILLAQKDNEAFDRVMDAFKLPKETEEEKAQRVEKIDQATFQAAEVPSEVIRLCNDVLPLIDSVAEKGNQNSLSDAGVAALLLASAVQGAFLNVLINCSSLKNQTIAGELLKSAEILCNDVKTKSASIVDKIIQRLK
ncbi:MAG: cyclodeaminase/cyclohydrolase family protein [Ignavibacteria bacterium]|jgi:formiminotetrahydrofolate cyclodeaminase|nr:cyclodeaminase/cyclohydrolase family protein [Ignavibacteria bacterium]MCU7503905.1 cyclodeaminase/cyclohydrolase family protein [Ignavibacteria bacterium]MCU7515874.1 cyclodeaminase/cyclohydrolase family protein [Ignavibacteria bacterium]